MVRLVAFAHRGNTKPCLITSCGILKQHCDSLKRCALQLPEVCYNFKAGFITMKTGD